MILSLLRSRLGPYSARRCIGSFFTGYQSTGLVFRNISQLKECGSKFGFSCYLVDCNHYAIRSFQTASPNFNTTVSTPGFPDSVSEGDIKWAKKVGDTVSVDEVIGEVETDKTAIPLPSPTEGVILELLVEDGSTVKAKSPIAIIGPAGSAAPTKPKPPPAATPSKDVTPPKPAAKPAKPATPAKVEQSPIQAKPEPAETRSVEGDPTKILHQVSSAEHAQSATGGAPLRGERRVKMNRMRLRIAARLKEAQNTCAMLTTFNEVDMSAVQNMRTRYKAEFEKRHGVKLGFMSAFVRGTALALKAMPEVNANIDDSTNEIVYRDYVDISIAVATPKGLVVPVIRNAETMDFAALELEMKRLGEAARTGSLAIEDMDGGTFTISNGGVFGSLMGTPIINPPQSAILGMHAIVDRPVGVADVSGKQKTIELRPMMFLALTYDHRLIDGREAVTFLRRVKQHIEDPVAMFLDL